MRIDRQRTVTLLVTLLMLLSMRSFAVAQQPKSRVASARGEGTIKVGKEEFKVHSVVVKLMEDKTAEITLVSDITIFIEGTWSGSVEDGIDLLITGGATQGGLDGNGKLLVRDDGKSIDRLTLRAVNKSTHRTIDVSFTAK